MWKWKFKYLLTEGETLMIFAVSAGRIWCFRLQTEDREILQGMFWHTTQ